MRNEISIFRIYLIEPKIKKSDSDLPVELTVMEFDDGFGNLKNQFKDYEEALEFLRRSRTNIMIDREYVILESYKLRS